MLYWFKSFLWWWYLGYYKLLLRNHIPNTLRIILPIYSFRIHSKYMFHTISYWEHFLQTITLSKDIFKQLTTFFIYPALVCLEKHLYLLYIGSCKFVFNQLLYGLFLVGPDHAQPAWEIYLISDATGFGGFSVE